ncbi:MAG: hypothetical protein ACO1QR_17170 [Chthoniobacteraceae bacterium]
MSAVQLGLVLFVLPKFDAIFEAMFSDRELPAISAAVVQFRWALAALACLLPFTGWLIARFVPIPRLSAIGLAIILAVVIAQIPATVIALFAPFISLVNSLSPK